jgi:type II secretory pathway pseudopilin PulG
VVIAIIGILSSVVLASLNTARNKGADAAIKSNINNSRAQAELYYDTKGNTYASLCTDPAGIAQFITAAESAGSADAKCAVVGTDAWAAEATLKNLTFYCVDSTGAATTTSATSISDTATLDAKCGA